jgi:hypothetical protein
LLAYLDTLPEDIDPQAPIEELEQYLRQLPGPVVRKADYLRLAEMEKMQAEALGVEMYKYPSNEAMFAAMGLIVAE